VILLCCLVRVSRLGSMQHLLGWMDGWATYQSSSSFFEYTYLVRRLYPATATAGRLAVNELTSHYIEVNIVVFVVFGVAGLRVQLTRATIANCAVAPCFISSPSTRSMFLVLPVFASSWQGRPMAWSHVACSSHAPAWGMCPYSGSPFRDPFQQLCLPSLAVAGNTYSILLGVVMLVRWMIAPECLCDPPMLSGTGVSAWINAAFLWIDGWATYQSSCSFFEYTHINTYMCHRASPVPPAPL
jgi:hypothetical protein